jgi:hypothetical protein
MRIGLKRSLKSLKARRIYVGTRLAVEYECDASAPCDVVRDWLQGVTPSEKTQQRAENSLPGQSSRARSLPFPFASDSAGSRLPCATEGIAGRLP